MAGFSVEADWWLYLVLFASILILLAINVYVVVIWQHPDDKNEAYFPKVVVLISLTVAELAVIFLPIDAANNSGDVGCGEAWSDIFCGRLNMTAAWTAIFLLVFILALFAVPYTIFYYEEDDSLALTGRNDYKKALVAATKYMVGVVIIVALSTGILFAVIGQSDVPVKDFEFNMQVLLSTGTAGNRFIITEPNGMTEDLNGERSVMSSSIAISDDDVQLQLSFPVFIAALMAFVGWFLFVIFGGLGMAGIPVDLIQGFIQRPQKLDRGQIAALEVGIQRRANDLLSVGGQIKGLRQETRSALEGGELRFLEKRKRKKRQATEFNLFKQAVYVLQEDFDNLVMCKDFNRTYNPLKPFAWLAAGVVAALITVIWVLHMILNMILVPSVTPFLNDYFLWFDKWFPLFGVLSVAIFSLYLLAACVKGCFKFGLRLVWFTLHPMKPNGTYMNSFLFNCGIILMCTPPVIQFTVQALSGYLRNTEVTNFFNVQVRYMRFVRYFFVNNVFIIALVLLALLAAVYLSLKPADTAVSAKNIRETLKRSAESTSATPPAPSASANSVEANGVASSAI